jgi:hypothetical protein
VSARCDAGDKHEVSRLELRGGLVTKPTTNVAPRTPEACDVETCATSSN